LQPVELVRIEDGVAMTARTRPPALHKRRHGSQQRPAAWRQDGLQVGLRIFGLRIFFIRLPLSSGPFAQVSIISRRSPERFTASLTQLADELPPLADKGDRVADKWIGLADKQGYEAVNPKSLAAKLLGLAESSELLAASGDCLAGNPLGLLDK
jgi:hypothetical protein